MAGVVWFDTVSALRRWPSLANAWNAFELWFKPLIKVIPQAIDDDKHHVSASPLFYHIDRVAIGIGKIDAQNSGNGWSHIKKTKELTGHNTFHYRS